MDTVEDVADPTEGADPWTETWLRSTPLTGGPSLISDVVGGLTGNPRDATAPESALFEGPGERPWLDEGSDFIDLPLGSPGDPLNPDGGPPGSEWSAHWPREQARQ